MFLWGICWDFTVALKKKKPAKVIENMSQNRLSLLNIFKQLIAHFSAIPFGMRLIVLRVLWCFTHIIRVPILYTSRQAPTDLLCCKAFLMHVLNESQRIDGLGIITFSWGRLSRTKKATQQRGWAHATLIYGGKDEVPPPTRPLKKFFPSFWWRNEKGKEASLDKSGARNRGLGNVCQRVPTSRIRPSAGASGAF